MANTDTSLIDIVTVNSTVPRVQTRSQNPVRTQLISAQEVTD